MLAPRMVLGFQTLCLPECSSLLTQGAWTCKASTPLRNPWGQQQESPHPTRVLCGPQRPPLSTPSPLLPGITVKLTTSFSFFIFLLFFTFKILIHLF